MSYRISQYLPEHARRAAVEARYAIDARGVPVKTCIDYCPLGVALHAIDSTFDYPWPEPDQCMSLILRYLDDIGERGQPYTEEDIERDSAMWEEIYDAAETFSNDWDDGKITDLRAALGVS